MVFKAAGLIGHYHIKRPVVLVVVDQPGHIIPIDDVDIGRSVQGLYSLTKAPQDR